MDVLPKRFLASVALAFALAGCLQKQPDRTPSATPATITEDGPTVAMHLTERYEEARDDCGTPTRPAFLCSGILMRSTEYSLAYRSWLPNPATASWGVAFSWLRQDSNFPENFPSGNGFIVYPWFYADDVPGQYLQLNVRCIYPQDAWTEGPDRCRVVCQKQGVFSAAQWLDRFTDDRDQCAFDVSYGAEDTAHAWIQAKLVRQARGVFRRNEVVLEAWPQNVGVRMPLEAFFYRDNCYDHHDCLPPYHVAQRRTDAKLDQNDFLRTTNRWVPVIRWTPATSPAGRARFTYDPADQGTPPPSRKS